MTRATIVKVAVFITTAISAHASSISATAFTQILTDPSIGVVGTAPCSMTSGGSPVVCTSITNSPFALASATASAGLNTTNGSVFSAFVSAHTQWNVLGNTEVDEAARSAAILSFDEQVEIIGNGTGGTLIGTYLMGVPNVPDSGLEQFDVVQGGTPLKCFAGSSSCVGADGVTIAVRSGFQFGVRFDITGFLAAYADMQLAQQGFASEESFSSFTLLNFTDQNGTPLQFVFVPEPGTFVATAAILAVLAVLRISFRRSRLFRGPSAHIQDKVSRSAPAASL